MTADQFESAYAERSGVTVEWLRSKGSVVLPCDCGDDICEGWQSVSQYIALGEIGRGRVPSRPEWVSFDPEVAAAAERIGRA